MPEAITIGRTSCFPILNMLDNQDVSLPWLVARCFWHESQKGRWRVLKRHHGLGCIEEHIFLTPPPVLRQEPLPWCLVSRDSLRKRDKDNICLKRAMSDNTIPKVSSTQDQIEKCKLHLLTQSEIERLGRQRPEIFKTAWAEFGFCFSLLASMLVAVGTSQMLWDILTDLSRSTL